MNKKGIKNNTREKNGEILWGATPSKTIFSVLENQKTSFLGYFEV